ncbi:MAG: hypothetical protein CFE24_06160 [Flavobacterium sp. BFFFF2]|nr:MAG: hypothetical protein CFE24_06160 [Flavobacterium sp. BFFFF2]
MSRKCKTSEKEKVYALLLGGCTQKHAAETVGVTENTVSKWAKELKSETIEQTQKRILSGLCFKLLLMVQNPKTPPKTIVDFVKAIETTTNFLGYGVQ